MFTNDVVTPLAARSPVTECHGVQLRAQLRSVAILVEVTGQLSPANRHQVSTHLRRFALVGDPLVVDLLNTGGVDDELVGDLRGVADVTLVVDPARRHRLARHDSVPIVGSVGDAMRIIAGRLAARRTLPVRSTAPSARPC
ncbi:hypothetical protein [Mycobacterium sp. NPDC006124]|uniref:hypothetical protein n=1 Tax=Mycobacterium sp. NPDC006124 TaxID=3156729 RepID=UPI0033A1DB7E